MAVQMTALKKIAVDHYFAESKEAAAAAAPFQEFLQRTRHFVVRTMELFAYLSPIAFD
jgi:hypothetical protein